MKLYIRVLIYCVMVIIYFFSTVALIKLDQILKLKELFITLGFGFTLINIAYSFLILKWKPELNIIFSIVIASLCLFLALKFANLNLFSSYDAYNIMTAILSNAVFSIIFWEILYQVKTRKSKI
ncbi:hypothetical protein L1276_002485 [Flavobacterium sp. HSC-32F16]|uniref:hypothetical protein n=1 Tax=Flavobacterium sp. HSC-32F16 TaxID=2910964 RepID=UPI0020A612C6|nr:hypothetical protein [Flavobacterium sp. HSC-32F16]MCP2027328.1 hypothetical protein [Flavobacterium sp. HSC-32F16]